jgi:hypothetical protein
MVAMQTAALLSPLLIGLVDPNACTWILPVNGARVWLKEHRYAVFQVLSVLPCNQIPEQMMQLLQSRYTLNHMGRLKLCTFLHGNGIGDANIRKKLAPLNKPGRDKDVDGILVSLNSGMYDSKWYFFSVANQIRIYHNGTVAEKLNDNTRLKIADYEYGRYLERVGYHFKPKGTIEKFYADYGVEYAW